MAFDEKDHAEWNDLLRSLARSSEAPEVGAARAARGARPDRVPTDDELGIGTPPISTYRTGEPIPGQPMHSPETQPGTPESAMAAGRAAAAMPGHRITQPLDVDPIAQGIVGGAVGTVAGAAAGMPIAAAGTPGLARVVGGAAGGAAGSKVQGGSALGGAVLGGGLAAAGLAAEGAAARSEARAANGAFKEYGRAGNESSKGKLEAIGPGQVKKTIDKYEIGAHPANAREQIAAARAKVGPELSAQYEAARSIGGDIDMGRVAQSLDELQARFGSRAGSRPFAEDVAKLRTEMLRRYGDKGTITPAQLNDEIGAIESSAYGGAYMTPGTAKALQRATAKQLDGVLQGHLEQVAQQPGGAEVVARLGELNKDYRVLSTLSPIAQKSAVKATFAETPMEKLQRDPKGAVADAAAKVATAPVRAAAAVGRGVDKAVGSLAVPSSAPTVAPALQQALTSRDRQTGEAILMREVFGQ